MEVGRIYTIFWANYCDLSRGHPKWWFSMVFSQNPLNSGLGITYSNLPRIFCWEGDFCQITSTMNHAFGPPTLVGKLTSTESTVKGWDGSGFTRSHAEDVGRIYHSHPLSSTQKILTRCHSHKDLAWKTAWSIQVKL